MLNMSLWSRGCCGMSGTGSYSRQSIGYPRNAVRRSRCAVFHECSYREVADRLGISVKTVEKHISRGIRETNRYLKAQYGATRRHYG